MALALVLCFQPQYSTPLELVVPDYLLFCSLGLVYPYIFANIRYIFANSTVSIGSALEIVIAWYSVIVLNNEILAGRSKEFLGRLFEV